LPTEIPSTTNNFYNNNYTINYNNFEEKVTNIFIQSNPAEWQASQSTPMFMGAQSPNIYVINNSGKPFVESPPSDLIEAKNTNSSILGEISPDCQFRGRAAFPRNLSNTSRFRSRSGAHKKKMAY